MTRIVTSVAIRRPCETVFDYVTTPANWPAWHPASRSVTGDAGHPLLLGETVVEDFVVAGRSGRATWRVIRREAPRFWSIEAANAEGRAGIVYRLSEGDGGTLFERDLSYTMATPWWTLLDALLLRRRMLRESRTAMTRLKQRLEAADTTGDAGTAIGAAVAAPAGRRT